ncbi:MAG: PleD family two-component system response regulator [Mariniblastus sp.]
MKVLVVDDCLTIRISLSKYLKDWGLEPVLAADAEEANEIMNSHDAPRLMIVDWIMPNVEGPQFIREFREQDTKREAYIIMLTAKSGRQVLETAFRCGADDYLPKPVVPDELYRRIQEGKNILERQDAVMNAAGK